MSRHYKRTLTELEAVASKFWPVELAEREAELSIVPLLLDTQEQFISILSVSVQSLEKFYQIIEAADMPANLFLKHLVILADFGGEQLQRISREFDNLFPDRRLHFTWRDTVLEYDFLALPSKRLSNNTLQITGKQLVHPRNLNDTMRDAIALLLFGSMYSGEDGTVARALSKCEIGNYLGRPKELEEFVKQRYIWVSRITGGAKANNLGQLAQQLVAEFIGDSLDIEGMQIQSGGRLPSVSHTDPTTKRETAFDLVVSYEEKHVAIEVSFQVTTNSTIERKAGQAQSRYQQAEAAGHRIAYVIDGAGNFERATALSTILEHSHCSVAFSDPELTLLVTFLRDFFDFPTSE